MTLWSRSPATYRSRPLSALLQAELNRSQGLVDGFDLAAYQRAHALMIGTGGIGSHVAAALVRKGLGQLTQLDDDIVETKNLTRQLFCREDIGKPKALRLARRLAREALFPTNITALPYRFQELLAADFSFEPCSVVICGVDNNPTRRAVTVYALQRKMPAIHAAVSRDGNSLYVMVQQPGCACWGCAFPAYLNDQSYPCNLPGIIDVLQVVAGLIVYAVDSVLCGRPREWNVRQVYLDGSMPDRSRLLPRRPGCALCTGFNLWTP